MDITLQFNGVSFAPRLSDYRLTHEISYKRSVTTLDGKEHSTPGIRRPVITFSLFPLSDEQAGEYYAALSVLVAPATYTDTWLGGAVRTATFRVVSDLEVAFGLRSVDGNRYYKGGRIILRAVGPIAENI